MSEISPLSLQIHEVIKTIRHVCTGFSLLFAVPAIVVIILCSNRVSKRYSIPLAMIVVLGVLCDIILQLIWAPLMLLSATCILRETPFVNLPGCPNIYYELWVMTVALNVPFFAACFVERHQAVQSPGSRWQVPLAARHASTVVIASMTLTFPVLLRVAEMPQDLERTQLQFLSGIWPTVEVTRARCFDYVLFIVFASSCVGALLSCVVGATLLSSLTFAALRQASVLSETMKKFNSSMTKVLIIQAIVPFILVVFPLIFSLIAVLTKVGGPLPYSICYLFISTHSPTHSIIMLIVTPMYRKKFVETIKRFLGRSTVVVVNERIVATQTD